MTHPQPFSVSIRARRLGWRIIGYASHVMGREKAVAPRGTAAPASNKKHSHPPLTLTPAASTGRATRPPSPVRAGSAHPPAAAAAATATADANVVAVAADAAPPGDRRPHSTATLIAGASAPPPSVDDTGRAPHLSAPARCGLEYRQPPHSGQSTSTQPKATYRSLSSRPVGEGEAQGGGRCCPPPVRRRPPPMHRQNPPVRRQNLPPRAPVPPPPPPP